MNDEYVKVSDAAKILGVSTNTVRNYVKRGLLKCKRSLLNRYRIFLVEDILELKERINAK